MPSITRLAFGSVVRGRAILARAAQLTVIGTIALGACDRAAVPTSVESVNGSALSSAEPGTFSAGPGPAPTLPPPPSGLHSQATYSGKFVLSVDAAGYGASCGTISVQKPAGATVQAAFLAAATVPNGGTINNGDITLNGTGVTFTVNVQNTLFGSTVNNYWGDVTSIVQPVVDPAAAGITDIVVCEGNKTSAIDGEILSVVFNDASLTRNNTIVLLFGAQLPTGDDFAISTALPIDKTDAALKIDMSLGISFGFQGSSQFSTVDVNGQRMTSSAGGQDDGEPANGALITAGGIGDTDANPPPNDPPTGPRTDDELYSVLPFVNNGDSNILVHTNNPSGDDNIFFAAFYMNIAGNVNCESTPPGVTVANVIAGPPKQVVFSVQDNGSGLQSIVVNTSTNANTVVDPFITGTTSPVTVTSTKIDQSQPSVIKLTVADVCQNQFVFDPFDVSLGAAKGIQALTETSRSVTATGISDIEHFVMIQNGNPGVKSVTVTVNGKKFEIANLKNGELRRGIDIGSAMTKGESNTVQFRSKGKLGAGAIAVLYQ